MKKSAIILTAVFSLFMFGTVLSQNKPAGKQDMPAGKQDMMTDKPEIVKKVMSMEGDWTANITGTMGGQSMTYTDKISFQSTAGDHGLLGMETMESPDHKMYYATHLVGYDPVAKQLHWYIVDNMGGSSDSQGELVDPNHIRLTSTNTMQGKTSKVEVNLVWQNDDQIKFSFAETVNGQVKNSSQGVFQRSSSGQ